MRSLFSPPLLSSLCSPPSSPLFFLLPLLSSPLSSFLSRLCCLLFRFCPLPSYFLFPLFFLLSSAFLLSFASSFLSFLSFFLSSLSTLSSLFSPLLSYFAFVLSSDSLSFYLLASPISSLLFPVRRLPIFSLLSAFLSLLSFPPSPLLSAHSSLSDFFLFFPFVLAFLISLLLFSFFFALPRQVQKR